MRFDNNLTPRGGRLMRLRGLIRKEFYQVVRDPSSIAIAFLLPLFLLLLFGYGVSLDAKHVPVAVVIEANDSDAASFVGELEGTEYFVVRRVPAMNEAVRLMNFRAVNGIIQIRATLAKELRRGTGDGIQVIVNGVDANYARIVQGYVEAVWVKWQEHRAQSRGRELITPASLEQRIWFNPEMRSRNFLVPGLIAVIMTLIGTLLTAMVMAREWERGTMEGLLVTPVRMGEIIFSKLATYFILGTGGMLLSVAMARFLFDVPLRGSPAVLFICSSLFLLASLGMGLLISAAVKNQFVAGQIALVATFLPAFILSGFIFDIASMPWAVRGITHIVAARYFVAILQTVFLAGTIWPVILPNAAALAAMALLFFILVKRKSVKRLD